jgi:hypothetical protein
MPKKRHANQAPGLSGAQRDTVRRMLLKGRAPDPRAECDRAYATLMNGDMPSGWDQYESRLQVPDLITPKRYFTHPRWNGDPFPGKTLLLHYEQGLGDTLMFVRFAPQVKARGGRVVLAAQAALADLVATCQGIDEVVPKGTPPPPFDFHMPLLSLPWLFRSDLNSIPGDIPYLRTPRLVPSRSEIERLLARTKEPIRVGLAWKGSEFHPRDSERSIPSKTLEPFQGLPGAAWYSFQREEGLELPFAGIQDMGRLLSNFSDTAFALEAMDLLITVDTAVAHLAGALGIPVLLLVTYLPDWRWMKGRDDSPWYPTMRIYRQLTAGDWNAVVQRVMADLINES